MNLLARRHHRAVGVGLVAVILVSACSRNSTTSSTVAPSTVPPSTVPPLTDSAPTPTGDVSAPVSVDARIAFTRVATIEDPIAFAVRTGDDHFYVATQSGRVLQIASNSSGKPRTVLDIHKSLSTEVEQGLLGLAFSRDGSQAYVHFTNQDGNIRIDAYAVEADGRFARSSRRTLLQIRHNSYPNHNGGCLVVGTDGMLYIGVGDGGSGGDPDRNGQNRTVLLGKILRIDPRRTEAAEYSIPADNPFVGSDPMRGEIWAYGLRNPWRFSFDRSTGDFWVGDVGQSDYEEIDLVRATDGAGRGANFGWSAFEASHPLNTDQTSDGAITPLYEYSHDGSSAAVIGGYVYRGSRLSELSGTYVFADQVRGTVSGLKVDGAGKAVVAEIGRLDSIVSFGEDGNGEIYALAFGKSTGGLYRVDRG